MPSAGHGRIYGAEQKSIALNATEVESLARFNEAHQGCQMKNGWPKRYALEASATGFGDSITVTCPVCQASENITDIESM